MSSIFSLSAFSKCRASWHTLALWVCALTVQTSQASDALPMFVAGVLPPPTKVERLLSAGNPTDVVLLAVAPTQVLGFSGLDMTGPKGVFFEGALKEKPLLGRIAGKGSTLTDEKIVALKPDMILDTGNITAMYQDTAKRVFERTQVPYVLLDGSWEKTPFLIEKVGELTGQEAQARDAAQWARTIMDQTHNTVTGKTFYLARGTTGLQTGQMHSIHTQALEWVGLKNVVPATTEGLSEISLEQLLVWNPDYIVTQDKKVYDLMMNTPAYSSLKAVKDRHVLLLPNVPFGWIDSPPALNRLLGAAWVSHVLQGGSWDAFKPILKTFYQTMYHITLTDKDIERLRQSVVY